MISGHGGNIHETAARLGCNISNIVDMSSNVNPLGPPPGLTDWLKEQISVIESLPQADAKNISRVFAERYAIDPEKTLAGNGTTQFIYAIPKVLESRKALILGPAYSDYADACAMHHVPFDFVMAEDGDGFYHDMNYVEKQIQHFDTVFVCNPNNPTGVLISGEVLKNLCRKYPQTFFIIDESYLPFVAGGESESLIKEDIKNLLILNSMSKIFRIPGLRIGFVVADQPIIRKFFHYYLPWSVNSLAQAAVTHLMSCQEQTDRFIRQSQQYLVQQRALFMSLMEKSKKIRFFDSTTSFLLAKLTHPIDSGTICDLMAQQYILIRNCNNFKGLSSQFIRISLKTSDINKMAAEKLLKILHAEGGIKS
ncbi:MAG: aminotransferase class I/II-fold pyridoxal phosphate-dependent enzyme [Desulfobacterales bacterium]